MDNEVSMFIRINTFITYGYSGFVVFCWILLFVSFLCIIRQCFCSSTIRCLHIRHFRHLQTICTCANDFPNEFTVRSYEYWAGQHWIISWMEENQTEANILLSRLFTYDIMKNFNYNISLWFFKSKFKSHIG